MISRIYIIIIDDSSMTIFEEKNLLNKKHLVKNIFNE